jgi:hypothetical protein
MILEPRPGRYRLHSLDSPEAEAVLAEVGVTRADLDRALATLERSEGVRIRSIVGINYDALFGSTREGWHPDLADACKEPFVPLLWLKVHELLGRVPEGSTARFLEDGALPGDPKGKSRRLPHRKLKGATAMDTDQLEHDMNELCHEWMSGKAPTDGVFGTVQAAARVFTFQALSAWTVLEETGQTEQLAPDFESWLRKILEDEVPYVQRISSVKVSFPKH